MNNLFGGLIAVVFGVVIIASFTCLFRLIGMMLEAMLR